jgi:hypothetical protein
VPQAPWSGRRGHRGPWRRWRRPAGPGHGARPGRLPVRGGIRRSVLLATTSMGLSRSVASCRPAPPG